LNKKGKPSVGFFGDVWICSETIFSLGIIRRGTLKSHPLQIPSYPRKNKEENCLRKLNRAILMP
jgi:hypothetical protein